MSDNADITAFNVSRESSQEGSGGAQVVACSGELDLATGPQLREALQSVESGDLIVDLCDLSFIDSTGMSILLGTFREFEAADRRLVVVCPAGAPRRVFELTGLHQVLAISDNRADADALLNGAA